jgi:hypothetical protein
MSNSRLHFIRASIGFAAAFTLMVLALPVRADDATYPLGSRVGLVPPSGMIASETFVGFADPNKDAAILITTLPAAAYSQIERTLDADVLKRQGLTLEKREPVKLGVGKGFILSGRQVADKTHYRKWLLVAAAADFTVLVTVQVPEQDNAYPDRVVRAALATLSVRPKVPEAEELGLLPFAVGDLAGFHIDGVLRGRALMLSDSPSESTAGPSDAAPTAGPATRLLIAAVPGGPSEPADHENFARLSFNEIGGIRNVHVTMSEPLRIGGQSGYQTMADAVDVHSGSDVMVVQWLRFGSGGFLQMIGVARADHWPSVLARLRTVRDSVEPK